MMDFNEIKEKLMGREITYYDGWNGSSRSFQISDVKQLEATIVVLPKYSTPWGVFIPKEIIEPLIGNGSWSVSKEIESCSFEVKWHIK